MNVCQNASKRIGYVPALLILPLILYFGAYSMLARAQIEQSQHVHWQQDIPLTVYLTRFVARHLYAPKRLVMHDSALSFVPPSKKNINCPLIQGVNGEYTSIGAWRGYAHWIEALLIRNLSDAHISLDPRFFDHRRIRGQWIASTFHHARLEPADSRGHTDSSVLYLVSTHPRKQDCGHALIKQ